MGQFQTLTTFVQQPLRRGLLALQMPAASRYRLIGHSRVGAYRFRRMSFSSNNQTTAAASKPDAAPITIATTIAAIDTAVPAIRLYSNLISA